MPTDRNANLAKSHKEKLSKIFDDVEKGFDHQQIRRNDIDDYWSMYNCELSTEQLYSGRNRLYAPFVYEAVEARSTRFINQLFPVSDRHVEAISEEALLPRAAISLCEHYVAQTDLRTVAQALVVSGDIEGQMNLYVDWYTKSRFKSFRTETPAETSPGVEVGKVPDIKEEEEPVGGPRLEILSDSDVVVLPVTSSSIDDALCSGGKVGIIRRWTKSQLKYMQEYGALDKTETNKIIKNIESYKDDSNTKRDPARTAFHAAGIQKDGRGPYALIYEIWTELEVDGEMKLCQVFMAARDKVLMARRNPLWCDQCPLLSAPVKRIYGSFKGTSQVSPVRKIQYYATDVLNEMADSANYTLLPIIMRDPVYITAPLTMAPAAIWDVPPNGAQFAELPPIWQQGMEILQSLKAEIFQVLSVNPAMVTQATKKKMNQAEVSQEQQIDILNTSDSVRVIKDGILNPLVNLFMALDYQYRDKAMMVRAYGDMGMKADMERIPPFELQHKTTFVWIGDEIIRSAQQVQQKIAFMNVLRQIPPQAMPHYQIDLEPILVDAVESIYGPRISRQALKSMRELISMNPMEEDMLMQLGHYTPVRPMDNPQEHIPVHQKDLKMQGDPFGLKQAHLLEHQIALQMQMQPPPEQQGAPGAQQSGQGPGARPGAQPAAGRSAQNPPGAIHQDQMSRSDPSVM